MKGGYMFKKCVCGFALIFVISFSSLARAGMLCPEGMGAREGDSPSLEYGRLIICGGLGEDEKKDKNKDKNFLQEFEVVDTQNNKVLFRGDALEIYLVEADGRTGLKLTKYISLPAKSVPFKSYDILMKGSSYEISSPKCAFENRISEKEKKRILKKVDDLKKKLGKGRFLEDEDLPYEILAAAMSGDKNAAEMLTGRFYFKTDGIVAETASDAMGIYEEFVKICRK